MNTHFHQQSDILNDLHKEAAQGGDEIFYYRLLEELESNSREWIFHQVHNKMSLEEHEILIKRKHALISFIKSEMTNQK